MGPTGALEKPYDPVPVSDITLAFPGDTRHLHPPGEDIPEAYWSYEHPWALFWSNVQAHGFPNDVGFIVRENVDPEKAFRHLRCVLSSFEMKHEYKMATLAFLSSLWFAGWADGKVDRHVIDKEE